MGFNDPEIQGLLSLIVVCVALGLIIFFRLVRIANTGESWFFGELHRRGERPGGYWVDFAIHLLALWTAGWTAFAAAGLGGFAAVDALPALAALCAVVSVRWLVAGFVGADNRYFRRKERSGSYWHDIGLAATAAALLGAVPVARWMNVGPFEPHDFFFDFLDVVMYVFWSLFLLVALGRTLVTGSGGRWTQAGAYRRAEWPGDYWSEVALLILAVWWTCWRTVAAWAEGRDHHLPASALLLMTTIGAGLLVRQLIVGFVSAENRYFRRTERSFGYWVLILFICLLLALLALA